MSYSMPPGDYPPAGQPQPDAQPQQAGVPPQHAGAPGQQPEMPQQPGQAASGSGGKALLFGGIGVVVGLLVGVLAGSTLLGGNTGVGGEAGEGAAGDAAAACAYVTANVDGLDQESLALDEPLIWQLQAAGALAQAAAVGDAGYQALGEQGMELFGAMGRLDVQVAQSTLTAMDEICQDL